VRLRRAPFAKFAARITSASGAASEGEILETVYDWISVMIFAGIIVLFLQRSLETRPNDTIWHYLAPSVGCALANYLGNEGHHVAAVAALAGVIAYILKVLKPFQKSR